MLQFELDFVSTKAVVQSTVHKYAIYVSNKVGSI
jgi:hypothetical protein